MQLFKPWAQLLCPPSGTAVIWEPSFPLCTWCCWVLSAQWCLSSSLPCPTRWMHVQTFPRVSSVGSFVVSNQRADTLWSCQITVLYCKYFVRKTKILHGYSCLSCSDSAYFHPEQVKKNAFDQIRCKIWILQIWNFLEPHRVHYNESNQ